MVNDSDSREAGRRWLRRLNVITLTTVVISVLTFICCGLLLIAPDEMAALSPFNW